LKTFGRKDCSERRPKLAQTDYRNTHSHPSMTSRP
jgi:hypothetical protein